MGGADSSRGPRKIGLNGTDVKDDLLTVAKEAVKACVGAHCEDSSGHVLLSDEF